MKFSKLNLSLLITPFLIFTLGAVTLFSTAQDRAKSQILFFTVGLILYFSISFLDFTFFKFYWKYIYAIVLALLIATFLFGNISGGAVRWLSIGAFSIQPSEFAKIAVVLGLAGLISKKGEYLANYKNLLYVLLLVLPILGFVFIQPDLGTTLVILGTATFMLFYAGLNKIYFMYAFIFFGGFSSTLWKLLAPYQQERIMVFFNPTLDTLGSGYNVIQAVISVGSGQIFGRGFGRGTQSHLQFLPAYWTDFIFAAFAEEWGFVGVLGLLFLFGILFATILYISYSTSDIFGNMICIGVFLVFFFQFLVNVGMNMGIMPVTGIPLPLFSYGGSSLIVSMVFLGLVQSVWIHKPLNATM